MNSNLKRKATIYDLAQAAGISPSTISAILNGTWKQRRISEETAQRVQQLADARQYSVNRQARGLRKNRSGLIGMIIPTYEDKFFAMMSQTFDGMARERKLHPIVASTLREPALEVATVRTLISYQVDHLVITGATDPDAVHRICRHHGVAHVNVDLPGRDAPSVVSDNRWGAAQLTAALVASSRPQADATRDGLYFLGGSVGDYATECRVQGFSDTLAATLGPPSAAQIRRCGYGAVRAHEEMARLHAELGGLPRGLLFVSSVVLEGAIRFLRTLPESDLQGCAFASYDWDPFASYLRIPVHMMCQDVQGLLGAAFTLIEEHAMDKRVIEIRPQFVPARCRQAA